MKHKHDIVNITSTLLIFWENQIIECNFMCRRGVERWHVFDTGDTFNLKCQCYIDFNIYLCFKSTDVLEIEDIFWLLFCNYLRVFRIWNACSQHSHAVKHIGSCWIKIGLTWNLDRSITIQRQPMYQLCVCIDCWQCAIQI